MQVVSTVFEGLYLCGGLGSLAAITAILHRLRYRRAVIFAPGVVTVGLVLALQAWVLMATKVPPFGFGVYAALMPALSLVTPTCIMLIALSKRLSAVGEDSVTVH